MALKTALREAPASLVGRQCSAWGHRASQLCTELNQGVRAPAPATGSGAAANHARGLRSDADEDRHRARAEHGAGDRRREEVTQRMRAMRAHDEQARPPALHLLEQNLREAATGTLAFDVSLTRSGRSMGAR